MQSVLNPPLLPRNGLILWVLGVARISTLNQDERSLADQEALLRRWLDRNYGKPHNLRMIATQGSGERLDRRESAEAALLVESRKFDLVLSEELYAVGIDAILDLLHEWMMLGACVIPPCRERPSAVGHANGIMLAYFLRRNENEVVVDPGDIPKTEVEALSPRR